MQRKMTDEKKKEKQNKGIQYKTVLNYTENEHPGIIFLISPWIVNARNMYFTGENAKKINTHHENISI